MFLGFLLLAFVLRCSDAMTGADSVANTKLGQIRGTKADDGDYFMFLGIPYAQVNKSNPFGVASPHGPFNEIFDAVHDSAVCPQKDEDGTIDCLQLNIYVPTTANADNLKSVLVLLYGGGFQIGAAGRAYYGPKYLVRHDVILITLNYRVGPYGFMCLDIPEVPGNQGLKDQMIALRWIKDNIQAFGGEPSKITAFGYSAGSRSIDFHTLSKHEKLIDQGIFQSGHALGPINVPQIKNAPLLLAQHLGYTTDNLNDAISFLATIDVNLVIAATEELGLRFGVCVEKEFDGVEGFLTEDWIRAPMPKANEMPILMGVTSQEGIEVTTYSKEYFQNSLIPTSLVSGFSVDDPDFNGMSDLIHRFYFGDDDISFEKSLKVADFIGDYTFVHPAHRSIARYLDNNAGDIFYYVFSYIGNRNLNRFFKNITVGGASHADEVGYLFDLKFFETPTAEDQLMIDRMTTLWTNFAKFGNPIPETSGLLPITWEPIKPGSPYHYLDLDLKLTSKISHSQRSMSFWDLFYKTNAHLQRVHA